MEQPEEFVKNGNESKVCKLKKSIYDLKQAAKSWNNKIHNFLTEQKFNRFKHDPCVYIKNKHDVYIIIGLHVDDFYIFSNSKVEISRLKERLAEQFKIRDLGNVSECLGMKVTRDRKADTIRLDQENYVMDVIKNYGIEECKPAQTPLKLNLRLDKSTDNAEQNSSYQKLIGALMYLAIGTRPDICFSVSYLSQFNNCNNKEHYKAAERVVKYLKGTINFKIFKGRL